MRNLYLSGKVWKWTLLLCWPLLLHAQEERDLRPVARTYALTNVTITPAPGRKIDAGTVIIKNGLIDAVGKNISIPPEAVVIKGDSLFVYAGFVDGLSHTGVTRGKEENKDKVKDPGNPPYERAGITPEAEVRTFLNPNEKSIEDLRSVGFTAAHVVPYGRMLPGSGAVILLHGTQADRMILASKASLYAELTPADRVYPNTVIGVMAQWRDLYRQATLAKNYESLYASNRSGLERPVSDRVMEAFYPVIDKRTPVLFNTPKFLDAQRALALQKDLGFSLMLADLKEGWDVIPKVKTTNTRVFLSLELPEAKKEEKKEADSTEKENTIAAQEKKALEKRKQEFMEKYEGQAGAFQKAGVPFGFSAMSVKPSDIPANLRRMIKAGLPEDQALASLTTHPAQLLGLSDRLGTIDNGKIANLVISHKPYFDEKAKVRYVFVEGVLYKIDASEKPKDAAKPAIDVAGGWTVVTETPQGKSEEKIVFKKNGSEYTGTISGGRLPEPLNLETVSLEGTNLKYKYSVPFSGQTFVVEVDAVVDGETFKGNATIGQYGSFPVAGKKEPNR